MTGPDFTSWMSHLGLNNLEAAERLDIGRNTVTRYKRDGAPGHIGLACSAIAMNLPEWRDTPLLGRQ